MMEKEVVGGDCLVCGVTGLRNLERHYLTNFHIRRADTKHTRDYINEVWKTRAEK